MSAWQPVEWKRRYARGITMTITKQGSAGYFWRITKDAPSVIFEAKTSCGLSPSLLDAMDQADECVKQRLAQAQKEPQDEL